MIYLDYKIILLFIICIVDGQNENKDFNLNQGFDSFDNNIFFNLKRNKNSAVVKFGNREFTLFVDRKTWPEAMLECARNSLEIVEVKTMNEARILSRIMLKNRPHAIESVWVGAYEKNTGESHSWRWLSGDNIQNDNELWKNQLASEKKKRWNECLLLDWHLWENPSFRKASCDRKRGYICQRTVSIEPEDLEFNPKEDRRFLRPSTTIIPTESPTSPTTSVNSKKSIPATEQYKSVTLHSIKTDKNSSNFYEDYYEDFFNNNWINSIRSPAVTSTISLSITSPRPKINSTLKPEIKIEYPKNEKKKSIDPLKLYYAFEGPVVGLITETELPKLQGDFYPRSTSRPKYHKYVVRRKNTKLHRKNKE